MLVSHDKLLSISLAKMQNNRQSAQVVRAHETNMTWQAESGGDPQLQSQSNWCPRHHRNQGSSTHSTENEAGKFARLPRDARNSPHRLNYYEESAKSGALSKKEEEEVKMPVIIPLVSVRSGKEMY